MLGLAALTFDLASVVVKAPFAWRGVTWGDAIEISGAYVVLALYGWIALGVLCRTDTRDTRWAVSPRAALLAFAAISYAIGHGIHVAANSAHDMLATTGGGDPWGLVLLWDEGIGHYLVDAGRVSFAIGLTWAESIAAPSAPARWPLLLGAGAYGFIYFATAVEGQTAPLALPFSAAYAAWSVWSARRPARGGGGVASGAPIRAFYSAASWVALFLFAIWAATQGGLPEFTKVGIL